MDTGKVQSMAEALAASAKPGIMHIGGNIYTLVFDHAAWVYRAYENGFLLVSFNTKRLSVAKRWLREHLTT